MRKYQLWVLAALSVFAFCAMSTSAFALSFETAELLVNGNKPAAEIATETTGKLLLENTKLGTGVVCEGILDGKVAAGGATGTVETVLNAAKEEVLPLEEAGVLCLGENNCIAEEDAKAWPLGLPWSVSFALDSEDKSGWILLTGVVWHVECLVLTVKAEDECTGAANSGFEMLELTNGNLEGMGAVDVLASCLSEGAVGLLEAEPNNELKAVGGGTLTISP